ncbi:hypothetical protein DPMN_046114 [Dreissena polymorpha]|uniref:Uncharacterized protein n=3 Tax=Dreissena polymorpha TaxID=45954 RepID=A0A9D4I0K2_DREPO|nr:hypothetical protein DPMN_046114 [Dreissena polymorpha]
MSPGPPAYRMSALPSEISGPLTQHITNPASVRSLGTTVFSPAKSEIVLEFESE